MRCNVRSTEYGATSGSAVLDSRRSISVPSILGVSHSVLRTWRFALRASYSVLRIPRFALSTSYSVPRTCFALFSEPQAAALPPSAAVRPAFLRRRRRLTLILSRRASVAHPAQRQVHAGVRHHPNLLPFITLSCSISSRDQKRSAPSSSAAPQNRPSSQTENSWASGHPSCLPDISTVTETDGGVSCEPSFELHSLDSIAASR